MSTVSSILWQNLNVDNEKLKFDSDNGVREVKKVNEPISNLRLSAETDNPMCYVQARNFNFSSPRLTARIVNQKDGNEGSACDESNIFNLLPLFCLGRNRWAESEDSGKDYTIIDTFYKTADSGTKYQKDQNFLKASFIFSLLTNWNQCISNDYIRNEVCLGQNTRSDKLFTNLKLTNEELNLYNQWTKILNLAKSKKEFISSYTYGLYQIENDINIKVDSKSKNKKREPIMVHKYSDLNSEIANLKKMLKEYYEKNIQEKLIEYELLK
jgi:hypothetical protein